MANSKTLAAIGGLSLLSVLLLALDSQATPKPGSQRASPPERGAAELYEALRARRATQLTRLHAYAKRGRFPQNTYLEGATPVFVDSNGVRCAVGELLWQDGLRDVVERIRVTNNLIQLSKTSGALPFDDWIRGSGLTREECELIQPSYDWRQPPEQPPAPRLPPRRPPVVTARADAGDAIEARLLATERHLRQRSPESLLTAVRRALPEGHRVELVRLVPTRRGLRTPRLPLVDLGAPTWVRVTYLDPAGKPLRCEAWTWSADPALQPAPAGASAILVEQVL